MTPGNLIRMAMLNAGGATVAQTIYAEEMYLARDMLNDLLAQWQRKRWLVYEDVDTAVVSTGANSYTVGPGLNFNIARPDRIEAAFVRLLPGVSIPGTFVNNGGVLTITPGGSLPTSQTGLPAGAYWNNGGVVCIVAGVPGGISATNYVDVSLGIIESREEYYGISLKSLSSFPAAVFYESAYPTGILRYWPVPPAATYELHIATKATLPSITDLTTDITLPPEYVQALMYNLACMLRPTLNLGPEPTLMAMAKASLNTLRQANTQIATLAMPAGVMGRRGSGVSADQNPSFQTGRW